jgi:hypothetical protein
VDHEISARIMKPWKLKKIGNSEFDSLEAAAAANGLHDRGSSSIYAYVP